MRLDIDLPRVVCEYEDVFLDKLPVTSHSESDPNGGSESSPGARLYTWTRIDLFFLKAKLVPVVIQTISVITKIIFIYK